MLKLEITETYQKLLLDRSIPEYIQNLESEGLMWWFNMDVLKIALHLQAVANDLSPQMVAASARLTFLSSVVGSEISETLMLQLYQQAIDQQDWLLAAAAAGAGCGAVWDSGADFNRFEQWSARIDHLLNSPELDSPLAHASILSFRMNAIMNGLGNLSSVESVAQRQLQEAEAARSTSLRIFHAALMTYCYLWKGRMTDAAVLLADARYLCQDDNVSYVSQTFLGASMGLFHTLNGETAKGREILEHIVNEPAFEQLPPSVWLLVQANLLFAIANDEDHSALQDIADKIAQRSIPQLNAFHHSFSHFSQGVSQLNLDMPLKALAHAEQAIARGKIAHSAVTKRMPVLLKGQALIDLGRKNEATALFEEWIPLWQQAEYGSIAATAALEITRIYLDKGLTNEALSWYRQAVLSLPGGEKLVMFHRPGRILKAIQDKMSLQDNQQSEPLIRIFCFGDFKISVGHTTIHDRKWKKGRTQALLKALIVFGGKKISTELLADFFWPDAEGDQAYRNLKMLVWRLRKLIQPEGGEVLPWLQLNQGFLSLSDQFCEVDVLKFQQALHSALHGGELNGQRLEFALSLYSGDFLAGDLTETWIIEHRERLRRQYLEAVLKLADAMSSEVSPDRLLFHLERSREIDPLDERVYEKLMKIHLAAGYPAKALKIYHAAQLALNQSLGIKPGETLLALAQQAGAGHNHD